MNKNVLAVLGVIAALAMLGLVGSMDYTDEVREQVLYCDNVAAKVWPDYEGSYSTECTAEKLKEYQEILR
jgi:hypothetical protein